VAGIDASSTFVGLPFNQTTELFASSFARLLDEGASSMIRIEGIPEVASRLSREPSPSKSRTNVCRAPRVLVIGKGLIVGLKAALQATNTAA